MLLLTPVGRLQVRCIDRGIEIETSTNGRRRGEKKEDEKENGNLAVLNRCWAPGYHIPPKGEHIYIVPAISMIVIFGGRNQDREFIVLRWQ